ncbi:MAG: tRNA threonylcarbamoyladenosine dehydratase [Oscillospiraceae bacterium]
MMDARFLRNEMLWGKEGRARLARAHVILFGLGGVGSYVAECLARSGIGELTLVDGDTVALSNLNRQIGGLSSTIGLPKAEAVARRIAEINPEAVLHPMQALYNADNRALFFPEGCHYDYIVDAIDLVSCKLDLAETARRLHIPLIMALGTGNKLDPSLLRLADISETYGCPLARVMRRELRSRGIQHQTVVFSPEGTGPHCPTGGPAAGTPQCSRQQSVGPGHGRSADRQQSCAGAYQSGGLMLC